MKNIGYLVFFFVLVSACKTNKTLEKNVAKGEAMGTTYSITYFAKGQLDLTKEIESVFAEVYQSLSTYITMSDISKINNGDSTLVVDEMFKEVFNISKKVYEASDGYFDPTVGVLVDAWGFGPGQQLDLNETRVDSLMQYVGFDKVQLMEDGTIKKSNAKIRFDFNAVAKGYAIDLLGRLLDDEGIENYLVEVGGEILTRGNNLSSEKCWTVGIDNPKDVLARGTAGVVCMQNRALASSGNYRKFRIDQLTGEKYVHTVDPKTGYTKNSSVLATTVIADDCATADAYATAFMAMEFEDTVHFLSLQKELDAFIIYTDDTGATKSYITNGFKSAMVPQLN